MPWTFMDDVARTHIVLASSSPRRRELLLRAGYTFQVVLPRVDESAFPATGTSPKRYAEELALAKAQSVAPRYPDSIVVGADTLVDLNGEIIGKPQDGKEAECITRKLFSAPHQVITGLALIRLRDHTAVVRSDSTTVTPREMTESQIARHVAGRSWEGKAGAYAIAERGDEFVERIDGSVTNVMGLPMELLAQLLDDLGETPLDHKAL